MPISNAALRALGSVVLMSLCFVGLGSAYSQEGQPPSLDAVTVTTQRYEQNLQTVPIDFVYSLGFASVQYARPREWGLTVTKDF